LEHLDGVDTGVKRDRVARMLRNTGAEHPAFAVVFSGVVKSGKSTVAKVLQRRYEIVRVENVVLRESSIELEEGEVYDVVADLVRSWDLDNKRLVLDASIDRSHKKILPALDSSGFPLFTIQMTVRNLISVTPIN
jgi:adenylate kinase family enzyme